MVSENAGEQTWYLTRRFRIVALVLLGAFVLGEGFVGIFLRDNDLEVHRSYGEAFLRGDVYGNTGVHYLPARIMINALTAWLPYRVNRAVIYVAASAALAWTLLAWQRLANRARPLDSATAFAAVFFTFCITAVYIQRDLDDCGLQLLLLFFLTAAAAQLQAGNTLRGGFWLGLAAVYKVTPILFLPYLFYKRQWKAAAAMGVSIAGLSLAPALWVGWDGNFKAHATWLAAARTVMSAVDPVDNTLEPPTHRNQSLVLALARLAQTYPPGHALYLDHPLFVQFGNLEPATAKRFVQALLVAFAGALAWRFRKRCGLADASVQAQREWALVTMLCAVLSPLCWLQHLVLVVPVVFLLVRAALEPGGLSPWQRRLAVGIALVMMVAGQRDLMGQGMFMVLMSYKVHTCACLLALSLVLALPGSTTTAVIPRVEGDKRSDDKRSKEAFAA